MSQHATARAFIALAGTTLLWASHASATVHYQTGFESPAFTLGPLVGQDSWIGDPTINPAITVQTSVVAAGAQAVQINAAEDEGNFHWTWHPLTSVTGAATTAEPIVTVSWDLYLSPLGPGDTSTKLWGIDFYNGTNRIAVVGIFDDIDDGPIVAGTGADGSQLFDFSPAPARGAWNTFQVVLNYDALTYDVILNGATLDSAIPFSAFANAGIDRTLADADFTGQELGDDSAYFDNFSVTSAPVPEPATATGLLTAALLLTRRRRRQSQLR